MKWNWMKLNWKLTIIHHLIFVTYHILCKSQGGLFWAVIFFFIGATMAHYLFLDLNFITTFCEEFALVMCVIGRLFAEMLLSIPQ